MTVESATYIDDLNSSYPAATDEKQEGDDHIRLIKAVLQATFPGIAGAVTATHTELNYVDGVTSAIQDQIDALVGGLTSIDSGTNMLFVQPAAPTGWTKITAHNDKALRIVSSSGGGYGGSVGFSTLFGRTGTDAFTLTSAHIPSHSHTFSGTSSGQSATHYHQLNSVLQYMTYNGSTSNDCGVFGSTNNFPSQFTTTGSADHTHTYSGTTSAVGSSGSHTHGLDMRVQYIDALICTKN